MPYMTSDSYRAIPFCPNTPFNDFYTFVDLRNIPEKCERLEDEIMRCRTIGILQSLNGRYYLSHFDSSGTASTPLVQVSVTYMQSLPQSTVMPYPVQIFGTLQWRKRPVIFAKILQVLKAPSALRLKEAFNGISTHIATSTAKYINEDGV